MEKEFALVPAAPAPAAASADVVNDEGDEEEFEEINDEDLISDSGGEDSPAAGRKRKQGDGVESDGDAVDDGMSKTKKERVEEGGLSVVAVVAPNSSATPCSATQLLEDLPDELKIRVSNYLGARHLTMMSQTCKEWRQRAGLGFLWKILFLQRWDNPGSVADAGGWRKAYIRRDEREKEDALRLMSSSSASANDCEMDFMLMRHAQRELRLMGIGRGRGESSSSGSAAAQAVARWKRGRTFQSQEGHACTGTRL